MSKERTVRQMLVRPDGRRGLRWGLVLAWMGLIFALSAQPDMVHHPDSVTDIVLKKLGHLAEYAVLAGLVWWALRAHATSLDRRTYLVAFVMAVLYAASDEWHQTLVPGRNGNIYDWTVDAAGAGLALVGLRILLLRRGRQSAARNLASATKSRP